ncbi:MAG: hypothetical protein L0Y73_06830, partial [Candidatus Aminicenantes bacterium]|nr:hypothetical protein [Candidatus Aminicenantes bacterium]
DSMMGNREADLLVKVRLKDGSSNYFHMVMHVEVQGAQESDFMERVFDCNLLARAIMRKSRIPVISLVVYIDDNPHYRPHQYKFEQFDFKLTMEVPVVKILDYRDVEALKQRLEKTENPMKLVVLAQLKSHEVKDTPSEQKAAVTRELINLCYHHGYPRDQIKTLLNFFDYVIRLPRELKNEIKSYIIKKEEELNMDYVPIWLRDEFEAGLSKGEKKGKKEGKKEGEKEGKRKVALNMLLKGLDPKIIIEYTGLSSKEIQNLAKPAATA